MDSLNRVFPDVLADLKRRGEHILHDPGCATHGSYVAPRRQTECPTCAEEKEAHAAALAEAAARERALDECGLDGRFRSATFDSFYADTQEKKATVAECKHFAATAGSSGGAGLFLVGPPGTGKTHLGSAIVQAVRVQRGISAKWSTASQIVRALRATWGPQGVSKEDIVIEHFGTVGLLVIDEVGTGFGSDNAKDQLFEVIDRRYVLNLPTVVLSNLPVTDIRLALGERSHDRLREGAKVLTLTWHSHRGQKR